MPRTKTWLILLFALLEVCVAPAAWGWSELFDRFGGARIREQVDLHRLIELEAARHRLPAHFVAAIVQIESAAQGCAYSRAGALGVMQLMPSTLRRFGVRDPFDPRLNVAAGVAHLAEALDLAKGDPRLAAAVYNAGPKVLRLPESSWPAETREYVNRKLPRLLPAYRDDGWRRHLPRYVDSGQCHLTRSNLRG